MHIARHLSPDAMDCSVVQVASVGEAWQLLQSGSAARRSAETAMNDRSSRSHCVLCVRVRGQSRLTGRAGPCNGSSCHCSFQPVLSLTDDCMSLGSSAALSLLAHTTGSGLAQPSLMMPSQLDPRAAPHNAPQDTCPTACLQLACGTPSCSTANMVVGPALLE